VKIKSKNILFSVPSKTKMESRQEEITIAEANSSLLTGERVEIKPNKKGKRNMFPRYNKNRLM